MLYDEFHHKTNQNFNFFIMDVSYYMYIYVTCVIYPPEIISSRSEWSFQIVNRNSYFELVFEIIYINMFGYIFERWWTFGSILRCVYIILLFAMFIFVVLVSVNVINAYLVNLSQGFCYPKLFQTFTKLFHRYKYLWL